jgi:glucose-6-phosphate 1-epimerase
VRSDVSDEIALSARGASARIAIQGARVVSWRTRSGYEILYRPPRGADETRRELRGGVPVCFPQFSALGPLQKHGFVQDMRWEVDAVADQQDSATARLHCRDDEATFAVWPYAFALVLTVRLRPTSLLVHLAARVDRLEPDAVTLGLHTYFRTPGANPTIEGLEGRRFARSVSDAHPQEHRSRWLSTRDEIDRIYPPCSVTLRSAGPPLRVMQRGFSSTVIWNPGPINCRGIDDLPDDAWEEFVCIEPASLRPVPMRSGKWWTGSQLIRLHE